MKIGDFNALGGLRRELCDQMLDRYRKVRRECGDENLVLRICQSLREIDSAMHECDRLSRPRGSVDFDRAGRVPLDDLALIRMEEDTPHFDVFSKDSAQLLFPFDQHKIEIPDLIELGEIAW